LIALGLFVAGCALLGYSKISTSDAELVNFSQSSCADTTMGWDFAILEKSFDSSQNISTVRLKVQENCAANMVGNLSVENGILYLSRKSKPRNITAMCDCGFNVTYKIKLKNGATNPKMKFRDYPMVSVQIRR
jgi:hypothetical protein